MILTIDIGNTRVKAAIFQENTLLNQVVFEHKTLRNGLKSILKKYPRITHLVVANVGSLEKDIFLDFQETYSIHFITNQSVFPFRNTYETPHTLGIDRMVLATGATLQYPNKNRLIIDAGTCITYDFISQDNIYFGGGISPGLRLRYLSLHNETSNLPLLEVDNPDYFIGNSTIKSIHSGVVNGLVYEIDGFIETYRARYSNFIIILTGGDADFLAKRLKNTIFVNSNFLLESLNQTFQYNRKS